ncbi:MAG: hypothetical protein HY587_07455 [Candidatus Omnitrophica bacterium]|nr:hypothetical protein [Candidatus Omnitrophota bacterium]
MWNGTSKYKMMRSVHWEIDEIRAFSTEEIAQKLKDFGVRLEEREFLEDVKKFYSACDLAKHWREVYPITAELYDEDFIWMACIVLWERWAPGIVNSEQIDNKMQDDYDLVRQGKHREACELWIEVWEHLKSRFTKKMKSIQDAERIFSGMQCLFNWCQDFEDELGIVAEEDFSFHHKRHQYCSEFCDYFPYSRDQIVENMKMAMAESAEALKEHSIPE